MRILVAARRRIRLEEKWVLPLLAALGVGLTLWGSDEIAFSRVLVVLTQGLLLGLCGRYDKVAGIGFLLLPLILMGLGQYEMSYLHGIGFITIGILWVKKERWSLVPLVMVPQLVDAVVAHIRDHESLSPFISGIVMQAILITAVGMSLRAAALTAERIRIIGENAALNARLEQNRLLHNRVANTLVVVIATCDSQARAGEESSALTAAELRDVLAQLRAIMRSEHTEEQPVDLPIICERATQTLARRGIRLEVSMCGTEEALPPATLLLIGHVIEEGAANALKHGAADTTASLDLTCEDGEIEVFMTNVVATSPDAHIDGLAEGGQGLASLTREIEAVGGTLTTVPVRDRWSLVVTLPCADVLTSLRVTERSEVGA